MKRKRGTGLPVTRPNVAVIYVRVSTEEQCVAAVSTLKSAQRVLSASGPDSALTVFSMRRANPRLQQTERS